MSDEERENPEGPVVTWLPFWIDAMHRTPEDEVFPSDLVRAEIARLTRERDNARDAAVTMAGKFDVSEAARGRLRILLMRAKVAVGLLNEKHDADLNPWSVLLDDIRSEFASEANAPTNPPAPTETGP